MPVPDDIYKTDVDFTALALQYPDFSKRLNKNLQLNFSDPESIRQLTKSLLHRDFNLKIDLPDDRLCPPVPNRFNYILFAQRLIDSTRPDYRDGNPESETVIGLDIGTGASAIYPLVACRHRPSWAFLVTEIDPKSRTYAERNIVSNRLESRIKILDTDVSGQRLIPTSDLQRFDDYGIRIQIVNPPFYSSEGEMLENAKKKSRPPNSACTGAPVEMIVDGGEVKFVSRLIEESVNPVNRTKIQWFSSMLGKFSSITTVIERLKTAGCNNYAVTEFLQGQKTRRWCVAWSWYSLRPPTSLVRGCTAVEKADKRLLPPPSDYDFEVLSHDVQALGRLIDQEISKLDIQWRWLDQRCTGLGRSIPGDVWSRKARRRVKQDEKMKDVDEPSPADEDDSDDDDAPEPALVFRVTVLAKQQSTSKETHTDIHVRWVQGRDYVVFESFCGWLKRKIMTSDEHH